MLQGVEMILEGNQYPELVRKAERALETLGKDDLDFVVERKIPIKDLEKGLNETPSGLETMTVRRRFGGTGDEVLAERIDLPKIKYRKILEWAFRD